MKKLVLFAFAVLFAASAGAETFWYRSDTREGQWQKPAAVAIGGHNYFDPGEKVLAAAKWESAAVDCSAMEAVIDWKQRPPVRCKTKPEKDAEAAQSAQVAAAAEAFEQAENAKEDAAKLEAAAKQAARTEAIRAAKEAKDDKAFREAATVFMESFQ